MTEDAPPTGTSDSRPVLEAFDERSGAATSSVQASSTEASSTEVESSAEGSPGETSPGARAPGDRPARSSVARPARGRQRQIRRVPKPNMTGLLDSPVRNLTVGIIYTIVVMILATIAYMVVGWSFRDALYMVIITIYTVGFGEVRPINTPALNVITIALIVLGCTGIIFLTGALVQYFTLSQLNKVMGLKRMNSQIDQLKGHVVVCGFGRLGSVLARSLSASSAGFVVLEENEARATDARSEGYLCIHGDATSDAALLAAGIMRASALATVLSNADKVVLPTHIGAERVAEPLLYEESARLLEGLERSHGFQRVLHNFGIELEVVTAAPQSPAVHMTVAAVERQAKNAFFIVQINRRHGDVHTNPPPDTVVGEGDGIVLIGRPNRAAILTSLFEARERIGPRG
jgi:voltage-gated potassium channel